MPDLSRNTFFDSLQVREISLDSWRALFTAHGFPEGLSAKKLTHDGIAQALVGKELSRELVDALQMNADLGTDGGRDAILEAAQDLNVPTSEWPSEEPVRDLAVRLWLEQRSRPEIERLVMRAQMRVHTAAEAERTFREFAGKEVRPLTDAYSAREALRLAVVDCCRSTGRGDYAEVRLCETEGMTYFELVHGHRILAPVVVTELGPAVFKFRPAHSDSVRYDPLTGRLGIAARSAGMIRFYRGVFGKILFRDEDYFAGENICTLRPLQERGRAALAFPRLEQKIAGVKLIECIWQRGERQRLTVAAPECFREFDELNLRLKEGEILQAKLEFTLFGKNRPRRKIVVVKVPNRIDFRRDADEEVIDQFLEHVGIKHRGIDAGTEDLWSLYPWAHPLSKWQATYGRTVDRMVEEKILVPERLERVRHPAHPRRPATLKPVPLETEPGVHYGVSDDETVPSRTLTSTDVSGLELDPMALSRTIARALGLAGQPSDVEERAVFNLGSRDFEGASIRVFLLAREPKGEAHRLGARLGSMATGAAKAVVLVPEGRVSKTGIPQVDLGAPSPPFDGLLRQIVRALKLENHVPANLYTEPGTRLVLDRERGKAWLDDVPLTIAAETNAFRFMALVTEAGGAIVTSATIMKELAPGKTDKTVVRKAKKAVQDGMKASFKTAGVAVPQDIEKIIVSTGRGYALKVLAYVA